MLKFYDIDVNYANYLRTFDSRIPNITYSTHSKFVCGVVLRIGSYEYFAPISSKVTKQQTSMLIKDEQGNDISSIKFSFMFPASQSLVTVKDFQAIRKSDSKYADLLEKELKFCCDNEANIIKKAQKVYEIGCNQHHILHKHCCDFLLLETKLNEWLSNH